MNSNYSKQIDLEKYKSSNRTIRFYTRFFFVVLLFSSVFQLDSQAALWACKPAKLIPGKTMTGCIMVNQQKRSYNMHVPSVYRGNKKSIPLVIGLHGGGGKPRQFESYSQLSTLSDHSRGFIVVYPKGVDKHWNDGRPKVNTGIDDIQFLKQLVTHLKKDILLPIDLKKIFIIGMSNGGLMALRIACESSGWVAGVGVVATSMSTQSALSCMAKDDPPTMVFVFGDKDTSFLPNGKQVNPLKPIQQRGTHIGIQRTVRFWTEINQCSDEVASESINHDRNDKTTVTKISYTGCKKPVVFYDVKNGGHRWPHADSRNGQIIVNRLNLGLASRDINTAEEMLKIFIKDRN